MKTEPRFDTYIESKAAFAKPILTYVRETVHAACNLFRTTPVGTGPYKLWRYCKVEARTGRELIIQRA